MHPSPPAKSGITFVQTALARAFTQKKIGDSRFLEPASTLRSMSRYETAFENEEGNHQSRLYPKPPKTTFGLATCKQQHHMSDASSGNKWAQLALKKREIDRQIEDIRAEWVGKKGGRDRLQGTGEGTVVAIPTDFFFSTTKHALTVDSGNHALMLGGPGGLVNTKVCGTR
ncbi:hypothetical protein P170DRAFT_59523 [Aspergillus steynii IBT 23096]|uniref:Uncharacterized protein n=1 Tax=Aspergillus steynii IBT 23096 TaxID=1392250 RepID=A0A2I2FSR0_9EURO|nr:uncharacterized protein P170DRAFT_59523 [Aspergillus steynii IBT 23096]PLB43675.1 hypothetical protein P170DRAFT_59523 [Aspergillus steynii IBT 23096]